MRARILVSLLSLMVICFGVRYAIGRERLRSPEYIHALYQETNSEFFDGQLPDVVVKVEDLSEAKAEGETYKESEELFVIVLDPKWNTSEDEALRTMRHESCHVATWGQEPDKTLARLCFSTTYVYVGGPISRVFFGSLFPICSRFVRDLMRWKY